MNNPTHKLENIKAILLHEFGHLFGYCLANKSSITHFCEPLKIDFGYTNFITPSEKIYHIVNFLEDRARVIENTKNIKRTIAWFIEVISGCDFETKFKNGSFTNCFNPTPNCSGSKDFANLSVIRPISMFKWDFMNIYQIQMDYRQLLEKHNIYNSVEEIIDIFIIAHGQESFYILQNEELDEYKQKFTNLITSDLHKEYLSMIEKYEIYFQNNS